MPCSSLHHSRLPRLLSYSWMPWRDWVWLHMWPHPQPLLPSALCPWTEVHLDHHSGWWTHCSARVQSLWCLWNGFSNLPTGSCGSLQFGSLESTKYDESRLFLQHTLAKGDNWIQVEQNVSGFQHRLKVQWWRVLDLLQGSAIWSRRESTGILSKIWWALNGQQIELTLDCSVWNFLSTFEWIAVGLYFVSINKCKKSSTLVYST